ncbi:AraC family transcriptional regulator [Olivibacter sp. CPCC 100613]|uniref:helix-turn-helix domain-containing protein n=1 Tax=Olivibacter sp. CPCC 100613 TaxID=3079931 RepID=UPI002FFC7FBA
MKRTVQTIADYYNTHSFVSSIDTKEVGRFDVFKTEQYNRAVSAPIPFGKKEYFKICIIEGDSIIHYADKSVPIKNRALFFGNSFIPYNWEWVGTNQSGYSCIFDEAFFLGFGSIKNYPVFQPGNDSIFELTSEEFSTFGSIFVRMIAEKNDTFEFKQHVLRGLVLDIVHTALKMRPSTSRKPTTAVAAVRITELFVELLNRQFPLEQASIRVPLRTPSAYASQLALHVNHLNKSVKKILKKNTTEVISQRILEEAKMLLLHSNWPVSEIAYRLGFQGPTHFATFIKKHLQTTPSAFRKGLIENQ